MLERQKIILMLLQLAGGSAPRLKLVKLAFLLSRSEFQGASTFYRFVPYKYGPFSFTLYHEMAALARDGYLGDGDEIKARPLAKQPASTLSGRTKAELRAFWDDYGAMGTSALLDHTYTTYPWFTVNSERKNGRAVRRPIAKPAVFTAGYEGLHVDDFLDLLLREGIQCLIDVRNNPVSRRYGFHKGTLSRLCERVGLQYMHVPQVGVPSAWRADLDSSLSYARLFDRYRREVLPAQPEAVRLVSERISERSSVLVCQEREACRCHRSHLAERVAKLTGLPIRHLGGG
jgi:uncharacterized protein (DUF488 family)